MSALHTDASDFIMCPLLCCSNHHQHHDAKTAEARCPTLHDDRDPVPSTPVWYSVVIHCQSA